MSDVDVILVQGQVGQYKRIGMQIEELGASYLLGLYDRMHQALVDGKVKPKLAIIHLSSEIVKHGMSDQEWTGKLITALPENTRRVLITGGINTPSDAKATAILLRIDMICDDGDFSDEELIKQLIGRGRVDSFEKEQRGSSVEIYGKREGPENQILPVRGFEGHDFRDDYHQRAKEG